MPLKAPRPTKICSTNEAVKNLQVKETIRSQNLYKTDSIATRTKPEDTAIITKNTFSVSVAFRYTRRCSYFWARPTDTIVVQVLPQKLHTSKEYKLYKLHNP